MNQETMSDALIRANAVARYFLGESSSVDFAHNQLSVKRVQRKIYSRRYLTISPLPSRPMM
jgi:hypothetical protein